MKLVGREETPPGGAWWQEETKGVAEGEARLLGGNLGRGKLDDREETKEEA